MAGVSTVSPPSEPAKRFKDDDEKRKQTQEVPGSTERTGRTADRVQQNKRPPERP
ncbi:hypothetical protein KIN20_015520 [Parelaphostrongylus tenuis]|uniref:Uncharacterized protein n=1 Tax=Parelaphostrongylus tenuis TaxID=148309 RepID=A0AAD5MIM8_PARTN|nr:hypothetical protein KIN20_015520 [Parelaphostrongylus tenuis]